MSEYKTLTKPHKIKTVLQKYKQAASRQHAVKRLAFTCEFKKPTPPKAIIKTITQLDYAFIITRPLSDTNDYHSITGTTIHNDAPSKINAELCSDWMRVYIDHDHTLTGIQQFLNEVHTQYPFDIVVAKEYMR